MNKKLKTIKKDSWVRGINSPFVHGQVSKVVGSFAYLDNGGVYPLCSLKVTNKTEVKTLPEFVAWIKAGAGTR